jgi:hydrogenase nickel incorporation protein HypB
MEIKVVKDIMGANDMLAQTNRALLDSRHILAVNLMSSPGAGKTSLITATIRSLRGAVKIGVIEGDTASSYDAELVARERVPVIQINTEGGCHLDAGMVQTALQALPLAEIELLFIENIGNLICPAEFALGEHKKVVITSMPEGSDKPLKYPMMFRLADAIIINKIDLQKYVNFDVGTFTGVVRKLNPKAPIFQLSSVMGQGLNEWTSWLKTGMTHGSAAS